MPVVCSAQKLFEVDFFYCMVTKIMFFFVFYICLLYMIDQTKIYSVDNNVYCSKTQCGVYRGSNLRYYNKHNVKAVNINYAA